MFTKPRVNVIESDEGFSVEVLGQTGLLYTEGLRTLHIDSEVNANPVGIALFKDSIKAWDSPNDGERIDIDTGEKIIHNIVRAFESQGKKISII